MTKSEKIAGCSPVAHLKSTNKATTNNLEIDISVGGKSHRATFENVRPGQSQTYDMFGLATPGRTCAEFPTTGQITGIPSCLVGGRKVDSAKCLTALTPSATMAQAVPLTK